MKIYYGFMAVAAILFISVAYVVFKPDNSIVQEGDTLVKVKQYSAADLRGQNVEDEKDKSIIKFYTDRPLYQKLPYTDGYLYISTTDGPQKILVQYKTTLKDANTQYLAIIKKLGDDPRHYITTFRKVNTFIPLN